MKTEIKYYIDYLCPGTFMSESEARQVKKSEQTIAHAVKLSKRVFARYNAKPYAFSFRTTRQSVSVVDGEELKGKKKTEESCLHHIDGKVLTLEDIPNTAENRILRSNMEGNDWPAVVETTNSYKHIARLQKDDVVLNGETIIARGKDYY